MKLPKKLLAVLILPALLAPLSASDCDSKAKHQTTGTKATIVDVAVGAGQFKTLAAALERAAAAATTGLVRERGMDPIPPALSARLKADLEGFVQPDRKVVRPRCGRTVASWTGWLAAAACLAWLLMLGPDRRPSGSTVPVAELAQRLQSDGSVLKVSFTPGPAGEGGEVLWSNQRQEGVLALHGIPPNDPRREQYQLWIVDPKRDAKLRIEQPTAFVITREQPGGVLKSQATQPVLVASVR
jgi:hypothetical protein